MVISEIIILSLANLGCYVFIHCVVVLVKTHHEEMKLTYLKAENAALRLKIEQLNRDIYHLKFSENLKSKQQ